MTDIFETHSPAPKTDALQKHLDLQAKTLADKAVWMAGRNADAETLKKIAAYVFEAAEKRGGNQ